MMLIKKIVLAGMLLGNGSLLWAQDQKSEYPLFEINEPSVTLITLVTRVAKDCGCEIFYDADDLKGSIGALNVKRSAAQVLQIALDKHGYQMTKVGDAFNISRKPENEKKRYILEFESRELFDQALEVIRNSGHYSLNASTMKSRVVYFKK